MSWIFGVIGQPIVPVLRSSLPSFHRTPLHCVDTPTLYIATGGIPETCFCSPLTSQKTGWLVVGCGIRVHDGYSEILSSEQWAAMLSLPPSALKNLDGHFIAIKWESDKIICYCDRFGLRTLHFVRLKNCVAFSTRLDWLCRLKEGAEIDFAEFGYHWQTFNQLSHKSLVKGITRLPPNSIGVCTQDSISLTTEHWVPNHSTSNLNSEISLVTKSLLNPKTKTSSTLSLGFSGGLDSRALLAMLLADSRQQFQLHLFGHPNDPDVRIARKIARDTQLTQLHLNEPLPSREECITMVRAYAAETSVIAPASSALRLRYYPGMHSKGLFVIDCGGGEIARRQYMNRLLLRAKRALRKKDANLIRTYTRTHRSSFFTPEINVIMEKGTLHQIDAMWESMPSVEKMGEENFVDLLALRYRFANWAGIDQARMDCQVLNYMPFVQPSFVQAVFAQPSKRRKNGRIFRQLISSNCPRLSKYPLVKGPSTYPYFLPTIPAWLWSKARAKVLTPFVDPLPVDFLMKVAEFVQDIAHSASVRLYEPYQHKTIIRLVDNFYAGKMELASEVDWWLSFELWRQAIDAR